MTSTPRDERDASDTSMQLEHTNALELPADAERPAEVASLGAPRWLLPAAERYAAAQAAPHTARTYRSTLRSFALYVQSELGLPPRTDALTLPTILDYKRHLQAVDPATAGRGRRARRSPSSSPPCAASRAGWRSTTRSPTSTRASNSSRPAAATRHSHAR